MAEDRYSYWKKYIEAELSGFLPEVEEKSRTLYNAMDYSLSAGGKRLRPLLLLETCSVCGGTAEEALPYACAIEFIHTYSLIHDDHPSMDDDDYRRGRLTNHKVFGDGMAILAGDGLLNSAFDIMLEKVMSSLGKGADVSRLLRAAHEISSAAGVRGMIAGQTSDLENTGIRMGADSVSGLSDGNGHGSQETSAEGQVSCISAADDAEMLLYIHKNKTGALIRAAVRAGALIGGASEEQLAILTEYAENLGLAFQITDDILDVVGDPEAMGKSTGADERLGKLTYPSVFGLEESRRRLETVTAKAVAAAEMFGAEGAFLAKLAIDLKGRIS